MSPMETLIYKSAMEGTAYLMPVLQMVHLSLSSMAVGRNGERFTVVGVTYLNAIICLHILIAAAILKTA